MTDCLAAFYKRAIKGFGLSFIYCTFLVDFLLVKKKKTVNMSEGGICYSRGENVSGSGHRQGVSKRRSAVRMLIRLRSVCHFPINTDALLALSTHLSSLRP